MKFGLLSRSPEESCIITFYVADNKLVGHTAACSAVNCWLGALQATHSLKGLFVGSDENGQNNMH